LPPHFPITHGQVVVGLGVPGDLAGRVPEGLQRLLKATPPEIDHTEIVVRCCGCRMDPQSLPVEFAGPVRISCVETLLGLGQEPAEFRLSEQVPCVAVRRVDLEGYNIVDDQDLRAAAKKRAAYQERQVAELAAAEKLRIGPEEGPLVGENPVGSKVEPPVN